MKNQDLPTRLLPFNILFIIYYSFVYNKIYITTYFILQKRPTIKKEAAIGKINTTKYIILPMSELIMLLG